MRSIFASSTARHNLLFPIGYRPVIQHVQHIHLLLLVTILATMKYSLVFAAFISSGKDAPPIALQSMHQLTNGLLHKPRGNSAAALGAGGIVNENSGPVSRRDDSLEAALKSIRARGSKSVGKDKTKTKSNQKRGIRAKPKRNTRSTHPHK
ncbi:hypothetical protein HRG_015129 [Hirsutella rhossiliensis]